MYNQKTDSPGCQELSKIIKQKERVEGREGGSANTTTSTGPAGGGGGGREKKKKEEMKTQTFNQVQVCFFFLLCLIYS